MEEKRNGLTPESTLPTRRRFVVIGAAGVFGLAELAARESAVLAEKAASRLLTPEATEGPYWVDEKLCRADVRLDPMTKTMQKGLPLTLNVRVSQLKNGVIAPLSGAYVDIWHCNADGAYSDMAQEGTAGHKFLRGYQITDGKGQVQFTTIYPGWYRGRTVHIHARVRTVTGSKTTHDFTTQFFFDEAVTAHVYKQAPYNARTGRDTFNKVDGIYNNPARSGSPTRASGELLMLKLVEDSRHAVGTFDMLLDPASLPTHSRGGGPGGPGGGFGPGGPGGFGPPPEGPGAPPPFGRPGGPPGGPGGPPPNRPPFDR